MLILVCLAQFMVILDVAVVNVALPSMQDGLGFSPTGLQWVVNAYTLTFAGFLMLGGRCADLLGRRLVLLTGTGLFAFASLVCAVANSRGLLIGARALQGIGGAIVSPATLSIITSALPAGPERNRAVGMWGAVGALGASSGALVGGLLTQGLGWPAVFAVNVPLGIVIVVLGLRLIPESRNEEAERHFDAAGATLVTAALVSLTFGIVRTDTLGWDSPGVLVPLAAGLLLAATFVAVEARFAAAPLVPLSVFRIGQLRTANVVVVLLYATVFPLWFFLTQYLQHIEDYGAIAAGLAFLPMTLSIFAGSSLSPRLIARFGPRRVVSAGMAVTTVGMLVLTGIAPDSGYFGFVLVGAVLTAVGMGCTLVPATIVATQGVPARQSGLASGLLNTSRLMGGALGLAVLSTIATAHTGGVSGAQALTNGYGLAFAVGAALSGIGAIVAVAWLRSPVRAAVAAAGATREAAAS